MEEAEEVEEVELTYLVEVVPVAEPMIWVVTPPPMIPVVLMRPLNLKMQAKNRPKKKSQRWNF